jgi:hypothetical protein
MKQNNKWLAATIGGVLQILVATPANSSENIDLRGDFHPREEVVYGHRAALEREEDQNRVIRLHQYQQQQYFQEQRSIERQNLYNQAHQLNAAGATIK